MLSMQLRTSSVSARLRCFRVHLAFGRPGPLACFTSVFAPPLSPHTHSPLSSVCMPEGWSLRLSRYVSCLPKVKSPSHRCSILLLPGMFPSPHTASAGGFPRVCWTTFSGSNDYLCSFIFVIGSGKSSSSSPFYDSGFVESGLARGASLITPKFNFGDHVVLEAGRGAAGLSAQVQSACALAETGAEIVKENYWFQAAVYTPRSQLRGSYSGSERVGAVGETSGCTLRSARCGLAVSIKALLTS
ncbi:hypothetical protein OH77DRAFT_635365 [Trametes cingulata]|nr:hypothetical protein OH77DRAFT_635365 [Trametes cingulata]